MKKILIAYATAGVGHKKAAQAVKMALDELRPEGIEVTMIDSLDYTNPIFKRAYLDSYLLMVNKMPTFWGILYYLTDNRLVNLVVSKLRRINNLLNSKRFLRFLAEERFDVIISTHFFASEVIGGLKRRGKLSSKLVTVVTDYRLHSWWVSAGTDLYVVGSEEAKADLARWGTDSSKVRVLGIPVEPVFARPRREEREALRRGAGLDGGLFTVLAIGGGFGVGPIVDIVRTVDGMRAPAQTIAICGHNDSLVKRLEGMKKGLKKKIDVHGYVNNVDEFMDLADMLISKSGGITVSESLAKELPMVVMAPIIGQETRNCGFLIGNGAAVRANTVADLPGILEDLIGHPEKMRRMREAIARIRKPAACYDIAKLGIGSCGNGPSGA